jgi:hypothetical protein
MAVFFIDTSGGAVATHRQLVEAEVTDGIQPPPRPWLRIQGTRDATTMWYAVMRRRERGIFIGSLVIRHCDHHGLLLRRGWEEVPIAEIGATLRGGAQSM